MKARHSILYGRRGNRTVRIHYGANRAGACHSHVTHYTLNIDGVVVETLHVPSEQMLDGWLAQH